MRTPWSEVAELVEPSADEGWPDNHAWSAEEAPAEDESLLPDDDWIDAEPLAPADEPADSDVPPSGDEYVDEEWNDEPEPIDELWGASRPHREPPQRRDGVATAGWRELLEQARRDASSDVLRSSGPLGAAGTELIYIIDPVRSRAHGCVAIETMGRRLKKDGSYSRPHQLPLFAEMAQRLEGADRRIVGLLTEARTQSLGDWGGRRATWTDEGWTTHGTSLFELRAEMAHALLPAICGTGRCFVREAPVTPEGSRAARDRPNDLPADPARWDGGPPWQLRLDVTMQDDHYAVAGVLVREGETMDLARPALLTKSGFVVTCDAVAGLACRSFQWIVILRSVRELRVPTTAKSALLHAMYDGTEDLVRECPAELRLTETRPPMRPSLLIRQPRRGRFGTTSLVGELRFDYDGVSVDASEPATRVLVPAESLLVTRDLAAEKDARARLFALGFARRYAGREVDALLELRQVRRLPDVVATLVGDGWQVRAEGQIYRAAGRIDLALRSGIDWFELEGKADFDGVALPFPRLLAAIRKGTRMVELGDGTFGVLPGDWLAKYGPIAALATAADEPVRFAPSQSTLLDALCAALPEVEIDETFARVRERIARFSGIAAVDPPPSFVGTLRGYQRDGLGWLAFLREMGFGGCLADDMGLGKTIQMLGALEARRLEQAREPETRLPSLVVVPRSLLENWAAEAARFVPALRVLRHDGTGRADDGEHFGDFDLVLCTYGTLRSDALWLARCLFDYVVLDEAQTIKNAHTNVAKAARLLRGRHRVALSGTPIENHLGELWSLFEFLNPGLLGSSAFGKLLEADARNPSAEVRQLLARALRPFILRRTKREVAPELPPRLEQTLYCNLEGRQRALYEELRDHYRATVLGLVDEVGIGRSKMHVLEALLRLRQAACHPGLIDPKHRALAAAKLELLLPMLGEVTAGGHKALVFSQFTSLLALVRARLDEEGVCYEYLDGHTRDRAARVERFQQSPDCSLFLVSLKAGGLGLNLTAADYVFLLDPWWNPAVEAQAIDRTHRIGQTSQVFAYRIIARGTIEEKVLALQERKRGLADDIIRADAGLLRRLDREDLELLLG